MKTKLRPGWVLALLCTVLFFYGFYLGGVQLVISEVSREYGQNAAGMGGLVAAQHVAAVVLPVVLGALADRIGKKPVLCIFAAVFAVGCFLAGLSKNLGVYVIGAVCVGAGYSVCESVSSAVLSELDAQKGARYINLSQALLSLGAVISPFLVQWLQKSRHASWRLPFLICAAAYTLLALLLLLTVFPKRQTVTQREAKARTNFFASRAFRLLFFSILLYVGLENGISYFAESLFSVRLSAGGLAAAAISAYWVGMTVSRMLFSAVLRDPKKTLIGCFLASAAFLLALAVSKHPDGIARVLLRGGLFLRPDLVYARCTGDRAIPGSRCGRSGRHERGLRHRGDRLSRPDGHGLRWDGPWRSLRPAGRDGGGRGRALCAAADKQKKNRRICAGNAMKREGYYADRTTAAPAGGLHPLADDRLL